LGIFEEKILEYDPKMSLTDIIFFDGAGNFQKAEGWASIDG
jgi:hypothetical protein